MADRSPPRKRHTPRTGRTFFPMYRSCRMWGFGKLCRIPTSLPIVPRPNKSLAMQSQIRVRGKWRKLRPIATTWCPSADGQANVPIRRLCRQTNITGVWSGRRVWTSTQPTARAEQAQSRTAVVPDLAARSPSSSFCRRINAGTKTPWCSARPSRYLRAPIGGPRRSADGFVRHSIRRESEFGRER